MQFSQKLSMGYGLVMAWAVEAVWAIEAALKKTSSLGQFHKGLQLGG